MHAHPQAFSFTYFSLSFYLLLYVFLTAFLLEGGAPAFLKMGFLFFINKFFGIKKSYQ